MTINCPVCGTANPDGTVYCEGCGVELSTQAAPTPAAAPAAPEAAPTAPEPPAAAPAPAPVETPAEPVETAPQPEAAAPADSAAPAEAPAAPAAETPAGTVAEQAAVPAPEAAPAPAPEPQAQPVPAPVSPEVVAGAARLGIKRYGTATGEFIPLQGEKLVVGRFDASTGPVDIDLTGLGGQEHISRRHAELYVENGVWNVRDLGSTNGVYVKRHGEAAFSPRLTEPAALHDGDEIAFGNLMLTFHQG